jgi:hypothetical protein
LVLLIFLKGMAMKFRDLFHVLRHPERESRCHELTDQEREEAARRVELLLAQRLKPSNIAEIPSKSSDQTL